MNKRRREQKHITKNLQTLVERIADLSCDKAVGWSCLPSLQSSKSMSIFTCKILLEDRQVVFLLHFHIVQILYKPNA